MNIKLENDTIKKSKKINDFKNDVQYTLNSLRYFLKD